MTPTPFIAGYKMNKPTVFIQVLIYPLAQEAEGNVRTSITVMRGQEAKPWFLRELSSLKRNQ